MSASSSFISSDDAVVLCSVPACAHLPSSVVAFHPLPIPLRLSNMAERIDLPKSSVARMIKAYLPDVAGGFGAVGSDLKLAADVKDAFARAGGLFVLYIANAADDACKHTGRSTVTAEDVLGGLEESELHFLVKPTQEYIKGPYHHSPHTHPPSPSLPHLTVTPCRHLLPV